MSDLPKEVKCVVWDLDNTIWDGVLSEDTEVTLKPGIPEILKTLDERGILHSVASRNNFDDAMKKLEQLMIAHYFLFPQINWSAKSSSIGKIRKDLNIGIDTFVFVDDDAFEREEVSSVHPEVMVVDSRDYRQLLDYPRLNPRFITKDSNRRRLMYVEEQQRRAEEESFEGPTEKFLAQLNMVLSIREAREEDLQRAEELTVRTNQLNATGRTYNYDELFEFMGSENHLLLIAELADKFGSYGKIGLALIEKTASIWYLRLLLMSCRVQSRGVGSVLMAHIMKECQAAGALLHADFKQTERNRMMYITYKFSNFVEIANDGKGNIEFSNDLTHIQPFPPYIDVQIGGGCE